MVVIPLLAGGWVLYACVLFINSVVVIVSLFTFTWCLVVIAGFNMVYACRLITWFDVLIACVAFCCSLSCFGFVVWLVWLGGLDVWSWCCTLCGCFLCGGLCFGIVVAWCLVWW